MSEMFTIFSSFAVGAIPAKAEPRLTTLPLLPLIVSTRMRQSAQLQKS